MNKAVQKVMFSSNSQDWATPQDFFDRLNWRFGPFDLDPCASPNNAKCQNFITIGEDGLAKDWGGHTSFVNPPYGRELGRWIKKAYEESQKPDTKVVMLIPARTDTKYWHKYVMQAKEIHLIKGRLKFGQGANSAPFPSAIVVFEPGLRHVYHDYPKLLTMERI